MKRPWQKTRRIFIPIQLSVKRLPYSKVGPLEVIAIYLYGVYLRAHKQHREELQNVSEDHF